MNLKLNQTVNLAFLLLLVVTQFSTLLFAIASRGTPNHDVQPTTSANFFLLTVLIQIRIYQMTMARIFSPLTHHQPQFTHRPQWIRQMPHPQRICHQTGSLHPQWLHDQLMCRVHLRRYHQVNSTALKHTPTLRTWKRKLITTRPAAAELQNLKRRVNQRDNATSKKRKVVTSAWMLTSEEGLQLAEEQEVERQEKAQKKKESMQRRLDKETERRQQRAERDPNEPFRGSLSSRNKADLQEIAGALNLSEDGTVKDLLTRITAHFDANSHLRSSPLFSGLFSRARTSRSKQTNDAGTYLPIPILQDPTHTGPPLTTNLVNVLPESHPGSSSGIYHQINVDPRSNPVPYPHPHHYPPFLPLQHPGMSNSTPNSSWDDFNGPLTSCHSGLPFYHLNYSDSS